jgi:hypothetical protein
LGSEGKTSEEIRSSVDEIGTSYRHKEGIKGGGDEREDTIE